MLTRFLLILAFLAPVHAHSLKYTLCRRTETPIKIDGDLNEWKQPIPVRVNHTMVSFGAKPRGDRDASYVLYTMWDQANLYVSAVVTDESIVATHIGDKIYDNDCIEICIDANHDSWEGSYGDDDFQFVFSVPLSPITGPLKYIFRNPSVADPEAPDVSLAFLRTRTGYIMEAAIPWKSIGRATTPKPLMVVGFQNDMRDRDRDKSQAGLSWSTVGDPARSPLTFGDLFLIETLADDIRPLLSRMSDDSIRARKLLNGEANETDNEVKISLQELTPHTLSRGFGWNVQFYNGHLPAWKNSDWDAYLKLLAWTKPAWVRYGLNLGQWEPKNDDDDPSNFNWEGFRFEAPIMQHHYRMLDFFEANGIDVMLCNWYVGNPATSATWLAEQTGSLTVAQGHKFENDAPRNDDEFIESLAALVHYLKVEKKYSCVKHISLWNEPDGNWTYNSPRADYPSRFWKLYPKFDARLKEMGLRDQIGIAGPDSATGSYLETEKIAELIETENAPLDLIADHDYNAFFSHYRPPASATIERALKHYGNLRARLDEVTEKLDRPRVDFAITEYGNHGNGPGPVEGDFDVFKGSLSLNEFVLRALPVGISGFLRWEFKMYGKSWQNFGALTGLDPKHKFAPYPPVFYPHAMLSRYGPRGAKVIDVKVEGGADDVGSPRVTAAAAVIPQDEGSDLSVWLNNSGTQPKNITLIPGEHLPKKRDLRSLLFHAPCEHGFKSLPFLSDEAGALMMILPPRSMCVLTTLDDAAGDLSPLAHAPARLEPSYHVFDNAGFPRRVVQFSFEDSIDWDIWRSSAGKTDLVDTDQDAHHKKRSCAINYECVSTSLAEREEHIVATTPMHLDGVPLELTMFIKGDMQGHFLSFLFVDDEGETFETLTKVKVNWAGWRKLSIKFANIPKGWHYWGAKADGILDFPLKGFGIQFKERTKAYKGTGSILIDDIRILAKPILPTQDN